MIYEDDGAEELVLDGEFDIAIPFAVELETSPDAQPSIRVFPSQKKLAEEFMTRFGQDWAHVFSAEAIHWARERFAPFLHENGFAACADNDDYFLNYRLSKPDRTLIKESTCELKGLNGLTNLTGYDFDAMAQYGHLCFGTVIDGKILSAACTNYSCALADIGEEAREIEIGVQTAEGHRSRGYATSNTAALACMLADAGYDVLYECESRNTSSTALIERLGGKRFAGNFCVIGKKY